MRKFLLAALAALALALPASAAKPFVATLKLASLTGTSATFNVTFTGKKNVNPSSLWVANICAENGVTVSAEYHPVHSGTAGPFTATGTTCSAFVWLFPDAWTPVSNVVDYPA